MQSVVAQTNNRAKAAIRTIIVIGMLHLDRIANSRISAFKRTSFKASKTPGSHLIEEIPERRGDRAVAELAAACD